MKSKISKFKVTGQKRAAFTLIELLVVMGTVALLSAVLLPALAGTKPNAIVVQCMENQRRLAQAFVLYAADYNGTIVPFGGMDGYIQVQLRAISWDQGGQTTAGSLQNFRKTVNSSTNLLFAYGATSEIIHCPGDVRYRNLPGNGWAYDSYSKTENVGGEAYGNYWGQGATYTNLSQVAAPAKTFAFKEDVGSRGYNPGTWVMNWSLFTPTPEPYPHPQSFTWEDPNPMYHGSVNTYAFVDGHVGLHLWSNNNLVQYGLNVAAGGTFFTPPPTTYDADYEYIYQGFRFPGWQQ